MPQSQRRLTASAAQLQALEDRRALDADRSRNVSRESEKFREWRSQNERNLIAALQQWHRAGTWNSKLGPRPEHPGCRISADLFVKAGVPMPQRGRPRDTADLGTPASNEPIIRSEGTKNCGDFEASADRIGRRQAVAADEDKRLSDARWTIARELSEQQEIAILEDAGARRTVRKFRTLTEKLLSEKRLPKHLKLAVDAFANLTADALGVAVEDHHQSTAKLISQYGGGGGGSSPGSRTPSDRQLAGQTALREMARAVPDELKEVFMQLVAEEVGYRDVRRRTLAELGEAMGYKHKQSSSAGGAVVYAVAALVAHFMRHRGDGRRNIHPYPVDNLISA